MEESIRNFHTQFSFTPRVENADTLPRRRRAVLAGMGGSHLAASLLLAWKPTFPLYIHRDYGLPPLPEQDLKKSLFIASSYSGNTEEVLDFADAVTNRGLPLAAICVGGKLLAFARRKKLPHVVLPDTGIQPRMALGFSLMALGELLGQKTLLTELSHLATRLRPTAGEEKGKQLASTLEGKIPIIYASLKNLSLAYNWKIKFNETGKIPAFYNVFPELNHNEMAGFDPLPSTKHLSAPFHFLFLCDETDHPQIKKRMEVLRQLLSARGFPVSTLELTGDPWFERVFTSLLLADWVAFFTARHYGSDPQTVPIVEELKKHIREAE